MRNSKVYDYIIVLRKADHKLVNGISQLMLFLAIVVFISSLSNRNFGIYSIKILAVIAFITGWWIYYSFRFKKNNPTFFRLALMIAGLGWLLQPGWELVSGIYFLAAILEKQAKFPQEIAFDEEEIVVNSLPKKYYSWQDLNNVVIKDGILTIDFKNNKLIQKEIESDTSATEEQEFNEFCMGRLNAERTMLNANS
jgi:hypothetical protein